MENWPELRVDLKHPSIKIILVRAMVDARNSMIFGDLAGLCQGCTCCQWDINSSSMCIELRAYFVPNARFLWLLVFFIARSEFLRSKCSQLKHQASTSTSNR